MWRYFSLRRFQIRQAVAVASGQELFIGIPIKGLGETLTVPTHPALYPSLAKLFVGRIEVGIAKLGSTARANHIIIGRMRKLVIATHGTSVFHFTFLHSFLK
jgi:hypothetical protein